MTLNKKWVVVFGDKADHEFNKLDKSVQTHILKFFDTIIQTPNPRVKGTSLKGNLRSYWRYRIGDYRAVCRFEEDVLTILIVKVAHRREVYKKSF